MDKQLFKKVEAILYGYQDNLLEIKNLELELEIIKNNYNDCRAIGYNDSPGGGGSGNTVENEVIARETKINKIQRILSSKKILKKKIDIVVDSLDKIDKKIVNLRYINGVTPWSQIAAACRFSESHIRQVKREKIVEKMANSLFPNIK